MRLLTILPLCSLFIFIGCNDGNSSKKESKKTEGLKIHITDSAKEASVMAQKEFKLKATNYDSTLAIFDTAFKVGDVAVFTTSNIPNYNENGELLSYDSDESTISILSSIGGVAKVENKAKYCYINESYQVDENGNPISETRTEEEICDTDTMVEVYTKGTYEKNIQSLFDLELMTKALKSEANSGSVTVDLLELAETTVNDNKAIRLSVSVKGVIDGENVDFEFSTVFSPDLPFVANPVYFISTEDDLLPQERILKSFNGSDIVLE